MTYKTILTVLTSQDTAETPLSQAASMAEAFDGHTDVLCLGVDRTQTG